MSQPGPTEPVAQAAPVALDARPRIGRNFRLQWEEVQKAWVLLYPEGMVKLNTSAGEILRRCDGSRTVEEIVAELEAVFGATGLLDEVRAFCAIASRQRWIEIDLPAHLRADLPADLK
jgi:pyrroloquinoline quinone biosynthesis protein D